MKPDWKDAPEWARWLAMDKDGGWWWHESQPSVELDEGIWDSPGRCRRVSPARDEWTETLEARPMISLMAGAPTWPLPPAEAGSEGQGA